MRDTRRVVPDSGAGGRIRRTASAATRRKSADSSCKNGSMSGTASRAAGPIAPIVASAAQRISGSSCVSSAFNVGNAGAARDCSRASAPRLASTSRSSCSDSCRDSPGRNDSISAVDLYSATVAPHRCCAEPDAIESLIAGNADTPIRPTALAALPATARSASPSSMIIRGSLSGRKSCASRSRSSAPSRSAACNEASAVSTSCRSD